MSKQPDAPQTRPIVTPAAEQYMRRMVRFSGLGLQAGFRLTVSPGGCSGISSQFSVEASAVAGDEVLSVNGLRIFLSSASAALLRGVTIDFADTPTSSGFVFVDPKAGSCACKSVSAAPAISLPEA